MAEEFFYHRVTEDGGRTETAIRAGGVGDILVIHSLAHVIWPICYASIISPAQIGYMLDRMYSVERLREEIEGGVSYDLLMEGEGAIGFAGYGAAGVAGECKLHKLYLMPSHQGRGLGSVLLRHVIEAARARGFSALVLNVNKHNA